MVAVSGGGSVGSGGIVPNPAYTTGLFTAWRQAAPSGNADHFQATYAPGVRTPHKAPVAKLSAHQLHVAHLSHVAALRGQTAVRTVTQPAAAGHSVAPTPSPHTGASGGGGAAVLPAAPKAAAFSLSGNTELVIVGVALFVLALLILRKRKR